MQSKIGFLKTHFHFFIHRKDRMARGRGLAGVPPLRDNGFVELLDLLDLVELLELLNC